MVETKQLELLEVLPDLEQQLVSFAFSGRQQSALRRLHILEDQLCLNEGVQGRVLIELNEVVIELSDNAQSDEVEHQ